MTAAVCLFDFDGTIIRRDSTSTLAARLLRRRPWRAPLVLGPALRVRRAPTPEALQQAKCDLLGRLLAGLTESSAEAAATAAAGVASRWRRPALVQAIRSGAARGARIVVASASPAFFLRRALHDLPVEIVATEFEVVDRRFTGALDGRICFGEAKAAAVLARIGSDASVEEAWTDSTLDREMMALARRRHWLAPPAGADEVRRIDPAGIIEPAGDSGS